MTIINGADSATLRIDRTTDIDGHSQEAPRASITGVISQYDLRDPFNGFYQLMPRMYSDFEWVQGVNDDINIPGKYALAQNYPNPFNPTTNISYALKEKSHVNLSVYNLLGQKVITLVNADLGPGLHSVEWNGTNSSGNQVNSGIYFYKIDTGAFVATKKMVLLK
jgi:hypothetical protein